MAATRQPVQVKQPRSSRTQGSNPSRPPSSPSFQQGTLRRDAGQEEGGGAAERMVAYQEKMTGVSQFDREKTIPALALRSFHLPGNESWCEDWRQYFSNNHPVLGICLHHPLHPIRFKMRLVILFGSIVFGLACTNIIWLWFRYHADETYFVVSVGSESSGGSWIANRTGAGDAASTSGSESYAVTKGMIVLWTLGGALHACFDCTAWLLAACACCLPGQALSHLERYRRAGSLLVVLAVLLITALSTLVVVLRAMANESPSETLSDPAAGVPSGGLIDDSLNLNEAPRDASAYKFLIGYAIELALALFVYNPLIGTVLFSGALGCGKVPVLGGRPYELACERREADKRDRPATDPPV